MPDLTYEEKWDAIALQLGHIVIHWSRIEFYLARAFYGTTGTSEAASNLLVRRLNARALESVILDLLPGIPAEEAGPIRDWVKAVGKAREWRNSALHSVFADQKGDGAWHPSKLAFGIDTNGDAKISGERITVKELEEFKGKLGTLARDYMKLPALARLGITDRG